MASCDFLRVVSDQLYHYLDTRSTMAVNPVYAQVDKCLAYLPGGKWNSALIEPELAPTWIALLTPEKCVNGMFRHTTYCLRSEEASLLS